MSEFREGRRDNKLRVPIDLHTFVKHLRSIFKTGRGFKVIIESAGNRHVYEFPGAEAEAETECMAS